MDYCRSLLCRLMETEQISMFAVSAKTGQGVEELKRLFFATVRNRPMKFWSPPRRKN